MSRYIHAGSFTTAAERHYPDGRERCDRALKKLFSAGPQKPAALMKRDQSDAALNAAMAKKLSRQERLRRSNAHETLQEIKKIHNRGAHPHLDEPKGDAPFISKSVHAIEKARERVLHVGGHRLPSVMEINKAFAAPARKSLRMSERDASDMHLTRDEFLSKRASGLSGAQWNAMTHQQRRAYFSKGLTTAKPRRNDTNVHDNYAHGSPQSLNGQWGGDIKDTGATNNWHDMPAPTDRPTIVGSQNTVTPNTTNRDAAVDAIKRALRKPQKMWGRAADRSEDQDRSSALDVDDEDLDDDDDAKNPNRADAFE